MSLGFSVAIWFSLRFFIQIALDVRLLGSRVPGEELFWCL